MFYYCTGWVPVCGTKLRTVQFVRRTRICAQMSSTFYTKYMISSCWKIHHGCCCHTSSCPYIFHAWHCQQGLPWKYNTHYHYYCWKVNDRFETLLRPVCYRLNMYTTVDILHCSVHYKSYTCTVLFMLTECCTTKCKISLVLLGVVFRPMKGERKQFREILRNVFGKVIDCRWQAIGRLVWSTVVLCDG